MKVMITYVFLETYALFYVARSIEIMGEYLVRMRSHLKSCSCITIESVRGYKISGRSQPSPYIWSDGRVGCREESINL